MRFGRHRAKLSIVAFETLIDVDALRALLAGATSGTAVAARAAGSHGAAGTNTASPADIAVIDCRFDLMNPGAGRLAYLKGHIPGAVYADLNQDLSGPVTSSSGRHPLPAPEAFAARLGTLGVANATQVIAYDDANGSYAARLWWMLRWLGHARAAVLDGGIKAWIATGGPLEVDDEASGAPQQPAKKPGSPQQPTSATAPGAGEGDRFSPRIDAAAVVSTAELAARLHDFSGSRPTPGLRAAPDLRDAPGVRGSSGLRAAHSLLVDARAANRYAGKIEPIDAAAGHVPGAVNHPFTENLAPDGRFLPAAELRRRWDERLAGASPRAVVAMCGSGVTACHNLLSLEVAGLGGAKLYAGSWSEWIRDPERPIARGDTP